MCERYGFHYVEAPNAPLGRKAQIRLEATRDLKWDYLLFLGSDDFISAPTLAYYLEKMEEGYELIAPMDMFYFAPHSPRSPRQLWHSMGYTEATSPHRVGEPMAVGRALSRSLVERLDFNLWPPVKRGLDRPAWTRLKEHIRSQHTFRQMDCGLLIFDVKTRDNLTTFKHRRDGIAAVSLSYMAYAGIPSELRLALSRLPY